MNRMYEKRWGRMGAILSAMELLTNHLLYSTERDISDALELIRENSNYQDDDTVGTMAYLFYDNYIRGCKEIYKNCAQDFRKIVIVELVGREG